MIVRNPIIGLALAGCALLSGCIAAAIPAVAGGAILSSQTHERDASPALPSPSPSPSPSPPVSQSASPPVASATELAAPDGSRATMANTGLPPAAAASGSQPRAPVAGSIASPLSSSSSELLAAFSRRPEAPRAGLHQSSPSELRDFIERQRQSDLPVRSALLADSSQLNPRRAGCRANLPPAVLFDLDPVGGLAPLDRSGGTPAPLAPVLDALRADGIAVAWITDRTPGDARVLRALLRSAGLDPTGADTLLVQRYPGERKQLRRVALGAWHCVLAIAGDTREDFDDLFAFLRDPDAALELDALLGQGWFLIANPLN